MRPARRAASRFPTSIGDVTRPDRVVLEALDEYGTLYRRELDGLPARAVQHEIDHLDGILFLDHLSLLKREAACWPSGRRSTPTIRAYIRPVKPASAESS